MQGLEFCHALSGSWLTKESSQRFLVGGARECSLSCKLPQAPDLWRLAHLVLQKELALHVAHRPINHASYVAFRAQVGTLDVSFVDPLSQKVSSKDVWLQARAARACENRGLLFSSLFSE